MSKITIRRGCRAKKLIREYFEEEIRTARVPPPPAILSTGMRTYRFRAKLSGLAAAAAIALAVVLLILSAGKPSPLSRSIDSSLSGHDITSEIIAFIGRASEIFRFKSNGG